MLRHARFGFGEARGTRRGRHKQAHGFGPRVEKEDTPASEEEEGDIEDACAGRRKPLNK